VGQPREGTRAEYSNRPDGPSGSSWASPVGSQELSLSGSMPQMPLTRAQINLFETGSACQ
jgi:hypothetical protein